MARVHARSRLTRRGRLVRTIAVAAIVTGATVATLGSNDDPAAADQNRVLGDVTAVATAGAPGTTPEAAATAAPSGAKGPSRSVVGFGDSVPAGANCRCTNFVSMYAQRLPGQVSVTNYAQGGSTSADALDRLSEPAVAASVRTATTVLIMTGANDFGGAFDDVSAGEDPAKRYGSVAKEVRTNVTAEVRRIRALNPAVHVVVLDYWGAMEDGQVAQEDYDADELRAAAQATSYVNDALAAAAQSTGATYVSTLKAFKGADGTADPTSLLTSDGDHPNATGHRLIADAIGEVLPVG